MAKDVLPDFVSMAWACFRNLCAENEGELGTWAERYEDDTGNSLRCSAAQLMVRDGEMNDPVFVAWLRAAIAEEAAGLATHYAELTRRGPARVWRGIMAPRGWDHRAERRDHIHWSWERSQARPIFSDGERGLVLHVIEGRLPASSIDWEATLRANLSREFGDECEIVKREGAPFAVTKVRVQP